MVSLSRQGSNSYAEFAKPPAAVGAGWTLLETIGLAGFVGKVRLRGTVAGAGLTHFKIQRTARANGGAVDFLVDADFNTATMACPFATTNLYQTAAGATFDIVLDAQILGPTFLLYAKSEGACTVALEGSVDA